MTKQEALQKGRKAREEKLFRSLYEQNKAKINQNHYVSYEAFEARVKKAWSDNPRYSEVKSLVGAGKKMLHTLEFIDKETIAIENLKEGLKATKTGRMIKWGMKETFNKITTRYEYTQKYKEETMFDVFRRIVGVGKKHEIWWDKDSETYRFMGADGLEYEIVVNTSPTSYGFRLVNS